MQEHVYLHAVRLNILGIKNFVVGDNFSPCLQMLICRANAEQIFICILYTTQLRVIRDSIIGYFLDKLMFAIFANTFTLLNIQYAEI